MAHFAKVEDGVVARIIVIANEEIIDENGNEQESLGVARCNELAGEANWVQTSYNNNIRKRYAGIGFTYDSENDVFIESQPYPSWTLDNNFAWQPPTPLPDDFETKSYNWDEDTTSWVEIN